MDNVEESKDKISGLEAEIAHTKSDKALIEMAKQGISNYLKMIDNIVRENLYANSDIRLWDRANDRFAESNLLERYYDTANKIIEDRTKILEEKKNN